MYKEGNQFIVSEVDPETLATLTEGYYDDRTDVRWAHPHLDGPYTIFAATRNCDATARMNNPFISREERIAIKTKCNEPVDSQPIPENEAVTRTIYTVKGLKKGDPDIRVFVVRPVGLKKKKSPVLFAIGEGAMTQNGYNQLCSIVDPIAVEQNVTMVYAEARTGIECAYPGPVDDYQAVYQWMLDNAKELQINPDNVVVRGDSGGGYTALCFAFRCKRVGFKPKGFLVLEPITDDRLCFPSSRILQGGWDSADIHRTFHTIVGKNNAYSPFLGPEVIPNHATVDDCKGLAPIYLHAMELDADRDSSMDFVRKLYEAKVYAQLHVWGGAAHGAFLLPPADRSPIHELFHQTCYTELHDMFAFDLRRDWVNEK